MQAIATTMTNQRGQSHDARTRALVRFNGLMFHSLATASFLETAVPLHVNRLAPVFTGYPDVQLWLEQAWWAGRAELGRRLRGYVEATWPEFDWNAAYHDFCDRYRPGSGLRGRRSTVAHEALGLCVSAAQPAGLYREVARTRGAPDLCDLARGAALGHAGYFDSFRALFERCKRAERVGFGATWRTAIAISRAARDDDVAAAFEPLGRNWSGTSIVPAYGYPEFRDRMAQLIQRYATLGPIERLLFRPWLERERATPVVQAPVPRAGRWLSPAAQPAAA